MNDFVVSYTHVLATPYIWQSMGMITAIAMFISPVLFNGDYRALSRVITIVVGYLSFLFLLFYSHFSDINHVMIANADNLLKFRAFWQSVIIIFIVFIFYILGLVLGVTIHKMVHVKR